MRGIRNGFGIALLCACLCCVSGAYAQQKNKDKKQTEQAASQTLPQKIQLVNTAMFIDAVKERLNENYDQAETMLHQVIAVEPDHDAAHYELAVIYMLKGRVQEALAEALQAERLDPGNSWYKVMLADLYNQTGQWAQGTPYWAELSERFPENLEYLNNYAYALLQQQKLKEAVEVYDRMQLQLGPGEQLVETKKSIWLYLKQPEKAVKELRPLMEAYPGEVKYYVEAAQIFMSSGKESKAVPYLEKARRIDSTDGTLLMMLYDHYIAHSKKADALSCLKQIMINPAIPMEPKSKVMAAYYQDVRKHPSNYDEAYMLLDLMVAAHPQEAEAWSTRADFLLSQQRYPEAFSDLQKVLELDSSKYLVWQYAITILLQQNKVTEAAAYARRASRLFPTQSILYFAMAAGLMEENDYESAIPLLQQALRYAPESPAFLSDVYRLLAKCYNEMGSFSKAEEAETKRAAFQRQVDERVKSGKGDNSW